MVSNYLEDSRVNTKWHQVVDPSGPCSLAFTRTSQKNSKRNHEIRNRKFAHYKEACKLCRYSICVLSWAGAANLIHLNLDNKQWNLK